MHVYNADEVTLDVAIRAANIDEAYISVLRTVLEMGHHMETYPRGQQQLSKDSFEVINLMVSIENPYDRVLLNPVRGLSVVEAVARFCWMLAGNDRVEDIAFYQRKVRAFSDNGVSVPGSDYGHRLFEPRPGLNQIEGVITRLRQELGSRRAAACIWSPEDAVRESHDIPCAFGVMYHLRGGRLFATSMMRSNNATLLFPYNVFEFTLLSEVVAATLGVELGTYVHFACSMHVFANDVDRALAAMSAAENAAGQVRQSMPPMPRDPAPLDQANVLIKLEAQLRHEYAVLDPDSLARLGERLHPYWRAFYDTLLAHALSRRGRLDAAGAAVARLPEYFRTSMEEWLCKLAQPATR